MEWTPSWGVVVTEACESRCRRVWGRTVPPKPPNGFEIGAAGMLHLASLGALAGHRWAVGTTVAVLTGFTKACVQGRKKTENVCVDGRSACAASLTDPAAEIRRRCRCFNRPCHCHRCLPPR